MTCDPHTYSPRGRQGLGVIQPQSGLDYPLIAPSEDIRYLIADFYFEYDDPGFYSSPVAQKVHPLKIKWLYGIGCEENEAPEDAPTPTHEADIVLVDSEDIVVFDSTAALFSVKTWGDDYKIYEWQTAAAICRLVVYTTWPPDALAVRYYQQHITPQNATIDERAVYRLPKRVRSIKVLATTLNTKSVDLVCGYNVGMETTPNTSRGFRHTNEITITADAGLGIGRYSDCTDDAPPIVSLNGATGPDITIEATDCLRTRLVTEFNEEHTTLIPQKTSSANPVLYPSGTLRSSLGSDCPACCACSDYVNTGRYMNCVRDRYDIIGQDAHTTLLQHVDNVARWVEQRECRIKKPLKIAMTPQRCPYVDVVVQFCNLCETCAEDVNINIAFNTYPGGGSVSVMHCYTVLSAGAARNFPYYIPTVSANNFAVNFGKVSQGSSADIIFRVEVAPALPRTLSATVTGTKKENGTVMPIYAGCAAAAGNASASATAAVACDEDGNTISVC